MMQRTPREIIGYVHRHLSIRTSRHVIVTRSFLTCAGRRERLHRRYVQMWTPPAIATSPPSSPLQRLAIVRTFVPFPAIGMKILAATGALVALKKITFVAVVSKYGVGEVNHTRNILLVRRHLSYPLRFAAAHFPPQRQPQSLAQTFQLLRKTNDATKRALGDQYSSGQYRTICKGLDSLEDGVEGLRKAEAAQRIWEWFDKLDKKNPSLPGVVLKTFVEQLNGTKAFKAVMSSASSLRRVALAETTPSDQDEIGALIRDLERTHPALTNYHVVLIKKSGESGGG